MNDTKITGMCNKRDVDGVQACKGEEGTLAQCFHMHHRNMNT